MADKVTSVFGYSDARASSVVAVSMHSTRGAFLVEAAERMNVPLPLFNALDPRDTNLQGTLQVKLNCVLREFDKKVLHYDVCVIHKITPKN